MKEEKIILETEPNLIEYRTNIEGWVGKDGRFYGNNKERAINSQITHKKCDEGHIYGKYWISCPTCKDIEMGEKYFQMPHKPWDEETPLVIHNSDKFFFDEESVHEYAHENEIPVKDLKLVICEANYLGNVEEEYFIDVLPEDMDLNDVAPEVFKKLGELNELINKTGPVSWCGGKFRTTIM